ncbi:TPA: hypothetical protein ROX88_002529 [Bacillus pseudomycoides]|nr:hypothetical protein [Bacillus pseudomycoides]
MGTCGYCQMIGVTIPTTGLGTWIAATWMAGVTTGKPATTLVGKRFIIYSLQ